MTDGTVRTVFAVHAAVVLALLGGASMAGMTPQVLAEGAWWIPFLVLNAGILAGNVAMLALSRRPDATLALLWQGRREDLEDNRRVVVEQLRVLEAEKDKLAPEDYARERAELVSIGTMASRELDESPVEPHTGAATQVGLPGFPGAGGPPTSPATSPPTLGGGDALAFRLQVDRDSDPEGFERALAKLGYRRAGTSGEWRGAAYTLAAVGLVGLLFSFAGSNSRERTAGMGMTGGDEVSGEMSGAPGGMPAGPASIGQPDPRVAELQQRLDANPKDVEALNELTEYALAKQDAQTALSLNDRALEAAPKDPDARVLRAVLLAVIDQRDKAFELLDAVLAEQPKHVRGLFFRGLLTMKDDPNAAVDFLERAAALEPRPEILQTLEQARAIAAGGPPPGGAPPAPPATGGDDVLASGTIAIAPGARSSGQVLFVSLRAPGGGPPMAALKLPPGPFPMTFTITRANLIPMMAGRPLPEAADVVATLSADTDPLTKDGDPTSKAGAVALGTTDLKLELR